jgi:hypothetical protein
VHFPPVHAAHPPQAGFFRITGMVIEEFGMYSIEVTHIERVGIRPRTSPTRVASKLSKLQEYDS